MKKMMSVTHLVWVLSMVAPVLLTTSVAAEQPQADYKVCVACHGDKGQGTPHTLAPALAGQFDWYIERQLQHFNKGWRGNNPDDVQGQLMQPFAKQLSSPEQIKALSQYISQLEPVSFKGQLSGDMKNGARYYHAKCGACHGGQAQGNVALKAPKLSHQDPEYLRRQIRLYQQGLRGTEQADKYGRQMALMANTVSPTVLEDILFYISEQQ